MNDATHEQAYDPASDERNCGARGAPVVMLDPGHGGVAPRGRSTPDGARGRRGTREKDLTLAVAQLLQGALAGRGVTAQLTRTGDENLTLRERTKLARAIPADVFVSLHFNASADAAARGAEVWVHDAAGPRSRALAQEVQRALGGAALRRGAMAALDPAWQAPATAACLLELGYLTNPDDERRFASDAHRADIARALADAIAVFVTPSRATRFSARESETFDIWHEVPLVPQLTGMSCWAAAAAMIVGWRECLDVQPEEVARGSGAWAEYREGLEPRNVDVLARTFDLVVETPRAYAVRAVRRLLERYGPLWVGAGPTGLHVVVVSGMHGDGTPDGTFMRVLDPWPLGRGERYTITFADLAANLQAATDAAGVRASILHCGEVVRGNRGRSIEVRRSLSYEASAALGAATPRSSPRRPPAGPTCGRYGTPLALFQLYRNNPPAPWLVGADAPDPALERRPALDERDWYPATEAELDRLPPLAANVGPARTADDADNPDLRHAQRATRGGAFTFTGSHLTRLAALNGFDVTDAAGVVLFGLRGCRLVDGRAEGLWSSSVTLDEDRPDHRGFHCVLGLWRPADGSLAAFTGSTVPNRRWMAAQRVAGTRAALANLLPTGLYRYRVGDHRFVPGVLVIQPRIVVRRSFEDPVFTVRDAFEEASPADNIHPAFHDGDALFSSAGCQTVPGWYRAANGHGGPWARFRAQALAGADSANRAFSYLLLTGREARLAAAGALGAELRRLRFGSSGESVVALQRALAARGFHEVGQAEPGRLDAPTALAFMRFQRDRDLGACDGIVLPADGQALGFSM